MYRNTYSISSGGSTWMVNIRSAAYTERRNCLSLNAIVWLELFLLRICWKWSWSRQILWYKNQTKWLLTITSISIHLFYSQDVHKWQLGKMLFILGYSIIPCPLPRPFIFFFSFKNVSNELIKTCLWQTVNWILKLMSALETATIFCQNLYPSMDSNILWRLCLQTQISNEAYIMHFNLQHCLNQALLVISLWENPCQLLLLQKKLVAGKKKWNPQSYSQ